MPMRFIEPNKKYTIHVKLKTDPPDSEGTKCVVMNIYPQSDFILIDDRRIKWINTGEEEHRKELVKLLSKYVVSIDGAPFPNDMEKSIELLDFESTINLAVALTLKSSFNEEEEKN